MMAVKSLRDAVVAGRVLPMTDIAQAESVTLAGDRVASVDGRAAVDAALAAGTPVYDFGDRVVLPGFVDPHAHVEVASIARAMMVDCRAPNCATVEDILQQLRDHIGETRDGWLVAQGNLFLDQKLKNGRLPTREELDSVSKDVAIALRAGGHTTVLNSKAFAASDVVKYAGRAGMMGAAVVETDESGQPTGIISELDAVLPLPKPDEAEFRHALAEGTHALFTAYGVTSIGEITETKLGVSTFDEVAAGGDLDSRLSLFLWVPGAFTLNEALNWRKHLELAAGENWLRVQGIKMFADGGYSSRNAATRTPYVRPYALRPGSRGKVNLNRRQVTATVAKARAHGLQMAIHTNGERAQEVVAAGVAAAGPSNGLPTRLEHAGNLVTDHATVEAWEKAQIVPIPQPVFLYNFGDFFPIYLGPPGARGRFPFRTLLAEGWRLCGSSDIHLGAEDRQTNPLFGVWCCVKRQSFKGDIIDPEEALPVETALRMHTIDAAAALQVDSDRGSLEPGKLADLIVLDRDPRMVLPDELPDINVDFVFVGGELRHAREGATPPKQLGSRA
jgi:predicted amidohydrolase YtcJ